jgi:hypothetical protein
VCGEAGESNSKTFLDARGRTKELSLSRYPVRSIRLRERKKELRLRFGRIASVGGAATSKHSPLPPYANERRKTPLSKEKEANKIKWIFYCIFRGEWKKADGAGELLVKDKDFAIKY